MFRYNRLGSLLDDACSSSSISPTRSDSTSSCTDNSIVIDLSDNELTGEKDFPDYVLNQSKNTHVLLLEFNPLKILPKSIKNFVNLTILDISSTQLEVICNEITLLTNLRTFIAKSNFLTCKKIPDSFGQLVNTLEILNLSGNQFDCVPLQFTTLMALRSLHLGGNQITYIPTEVNRLTNLEVLYLGGNELETIPEEIGDLRQLISLSLCDNKLHSLPSSLKNLKHLRSLQLHNNLLNVLPLEIVCIDLVELSLRDNPLVKRFVENLQAEIPTLKELAGRVISSENLPTSSLPPSLRRYIASGQRCVNPYCKGVYFTSRVEHVKFVDFCGKYRIPLLQYLCSTQCVEAAYSVGYQGRNPRVRRTSIDNSPTQSGASDSEEEWEREAQRRMKRVLLG